MSEQQRSPLAGDDDVEGHGTRGFRGADAEQAEGDDVEGHGTRGFRGADAEQAEDDDVEGHARRQGGF